MQEINRIFCKCNFLVMRVSMTLLGVIFLGWGFFVELFIGWGFGGSFFLAFFIWGTFLWLSVALPRVYKYELPAIRMHCLNSSWTVSWSVSGVVLKWLGKSETIFEPLTRVNFTSYVMLNFWLFCRNFALQIKSFLVM